MTPASWPRLLTLPAALPGPAVRGRARPPARRANSRPAPRLEVLEDRTVPAVVGYYDMVLGEGDVRQEAGILDAGHTPVRLLDLQPADLAGIDVLLVQNPDNLAYGAEFCNNLPAVQDAVAGGLVLIIHDRFVDNAESILPGGAGFDVRRYQPDPFYEPAASNIDVLDPSATLADGPGGVIDNSTLDGGTSSNHGYALAASLPADAHLYLSNGTPDQVVAFSYSFGAGSVFYSTIPLDYYLGSENPLGSDNSFALVYAPNAVAQGVALHNSPPVADEGQLTLLEDTSAFGTLSASDPDGDALQFSIVTGPVHGTLTLTDPATGEFVYTPDPNFHGDDSFTFSVSDGMTVSNLATVNLSVLPVNDPPVAGPASLVTDEDTPAGGTLPASDVEGDALTYSIVKGPAHGVVVLTDPATGEFVYTPDPDFHGADSFTFSVSDGADSYTEPPSEGGPVTEPAEVTITVLPVNDAPAILSLSASPQPVVEGGSVVLTGQIGDPEVSSHAVFIDWGDGSPVEVFALSPGATSFAVSHVYAGTAPGQAVAPFTVTVTVADEGQQSTTATTTVQVANVAPSVSAGGDEFVNVGNLFRRAGSFADPGANAFTATVDYGDGGGPQALALGPGGTFLLEHVYTREGSFLVTVVVADDRGGVGAAAFFADVLLPGIPTGLARKVDVGLGETDTVGTLGVTATVTHRSGAPLAFLIVDVVPPPVAEVLTAGDGLRIVGAYDVRSVGLGDEDTAVITFAYTGDFPGLPVLSFLDEAGNTQVVLTSQLAPGSVRVDTAARTITIVLDRTSRPFLTSLNRTVFTVSVPTTVEAPGAGASLTVGLVFTLTTLDSRAPGVVPAAGSAEARGTTAATGAVVNAAGVSAVPGIGAVGGGDARGPEGEGGPLSHLPETAPTLITLPALSVSPARPAEPAADAPLEAPAPPPVPAGEESRTGKTPPAAPAAPALPTSGNKAEPVLEVEGGTEPDGGEDRVGEEAPPAPAAGWAPTLLGAAAWLADRRRARPKAEGRNRKEEGSAPPP